MQRKLVILNHYFHVDAVLRLLHTISEFYQFH